MLEHQAVELVDRMQAIWPARSWTPEHCREWVEYFAGGPDGGLRRDVADIALEHLKRSKKNRPSIAEFQAEARAAYSRMPQPDDLELIAEDPDEQQPPLPPDEIARRAGALKEQLRSMPQPPPRRTT